MISFELKIKVVEGIAKKMNTLIDVKSEDLKDTTFFIKRTTKGDYYLIPASFRIGAPNPNVISYLIDGVIYTYQKDYVITHAQKDYDLVYANNIPTNNLITSYINHKGLKKIHLRKLTSFNLRYYGLVIDLNERVNWEYERYGLIYNPLTKQELLNEELDEKKKEEEMNGKKI